MTTHCDNVEGDADWTDWFYDSAPPSAPPPALSNDGLEPFYILPDGEEVHPVSNNGSMAVPSELVSGCQRLETVPLGVPVVPLGVPVDIAPVLEPIEAFPMGSGFPVTTSSVSRSRSPSLDLFSGDQEGLQVQGLETVSTDVAPAVWGLMEPMEPTEPKKPVKKPVKKNLKRNLKRHKLKRPASLKACVNPLCTHSMGCKAGQCKVCKVVQPYKNPKAGRPPNANVGSGNSRVNCWKCLSEWGSKKYCCDCGATNKWDNLTLKRPSESSEYSESPVAKKQRVEVRMVV